MGKKTLRYRWFGIGKMPEALRARLDPEGLLFFTEGISVKVRARARTPGARSHSVSLKCGAFAVTRSRLVATVSRRKVVDLPLAAPGGSDGAASLRLEADGLHLSVDVGRAHPEGEGTIDLHFREELSAELLASFPTTMLAGPVTPEAAQGLLRSVVNGFLGSDAG